jgi:hypothetical protein
LRTQTIAPENWDHFFADFNHDHLGWAVTIETMTESESHTLASRLEFQGISFDTKGSRPSTLQISVGDSGHAHLAHAVHLPLHIRKIEDRGGNLHLLIEPADGEPTFVHLRAPSHAVRTVLQL